MNPYLEAFEAYHATGEPDTPWTTALDFHLQHGVVFSDNAAFLMARPVRPGVADFIHTRLNSYTPSQLGPDPEWHIWIAAGDPDVMNQLAFEQGLTDDTVITFARLRSPRLRRYTLARLRRHLRL